LNLYAVALYDGSIQLYRVVRPWQSSRMKTGYLYSAEKRLGLLKTGHNLHDSATQLNWYLEFWIFAEIRCIVNCSF